MGSDKDVVNVWRPHTLVAMSKHAVLGAFRGVLRLRIGERSVMRHFCLIIIIIIVQKEEVRNNNANEEGRRGKKVEKPRRLLLSEETSACEGTST